MANAIDPAVEDQLEEVYGIVPLVKFEIPDFVRGYYRGPRPLDFNGFTYQANTLVGIEDFAETLDNDDEERRVTLVGLENEAESTASVIASKNYIGAPATVSRLIVDVSTSEIIGLAETSFYEIYDLSISNEREDDVSIVNVDVDLRSVGYTGRRKTSAIRSTAVHQEGFNANSTFYEESDKAATVQREWGSRYA